MTNKLKFSMLIGVLLLFSLSIFPSFAQNDFTPTFEATPCWFEVPSGTTVDCGFVTVPENRDKPVNTNTVRLAVAVMRSQSANPNPDPIIYLDGGPGGDTIDSLESFYLGAFGTVDANTDRDVIFFDQRGIGYSEPRLFCQDTIDLEYDILDDLISIEEENEMYDEAVFTCRDRYLDQGIDLNSFNSSQNAADVNDIRIALGYDEINLLGISYGSLLAQVIMRDFPETVRSSILDAVVLPESLQFTLAGQLISIDGALQGLFDACEADDFCNSQYPDLENTLLEVASSWNENPEPLIVATLTDAQDAIENTYPALASGDDLMGAITLMLYSRGFIPLIPQMIYDVSQGNYNTLGIILGFRLEQGEGFSEVMMLSVICLEDGPYLNEPLFQEVRGSVSEVALQYVPESSIPDSYLIDYCNRWVQGGSAPEVYSPIVSDIPTLLLSGEFDPVTPFEYAEQVAENLSTSYSYLFPAFGHGASLAGGCPTDIASAFINNPTVEPDASCIADMPPISFQ